jgi:hypothetical protein
MNTSRKALMVAALMLATAAHALGQEMR